MIYDGTEQSFNEAKAFCDEHGVSLAKTVFGKFKPAPGEDPTIHGLLLDETWVVLPGDEIYLAGGNIYSRSVPIS